jgi:dTDP-4-amino-4,6-dideoxygalactose transaminase
MQFIDLKTQQSRIRPEIEKRIATVLDHGKYINGPEVRELEELLADYVGTRYAVGCSSGTDALLMPLMAWNIGPGDAVFTTTFSFFATAEVVALLGAEPVFVDIDPVTYAIDPALLEKKIEKVRREGRLKPKAIMPVDIFGQAADYDEILTIGKKYDLPVLEDAAQSFGGTYREKRCCSFGQCGATSFFPAKPLGCYGDGGMIFTDDESLHRELLSIRVHGQGSDKYDNVRIGLNGRLDTIQAAILLAKMEIFDDELEKKQAVAGSYSRLLEDSARVPVVLEGNLSAWAQYSIQVDDRAAVLDRLRERGIPANVYYRQPLAFQSAYAYLGYEKGDFPVAEEVCERILSLPMHAYLTDEEIERVVRVLGSREQG